MAEKFDPELPEEPDEIDTRGSNGMPPLLELLRCEQLRRVYHDGDRV